MNEAFYADLPTISMFTAITDPHLYIDVPADWLVIITDVVDSTNAVAEGRYRDINFIGAAAIVALLNIAMPLEIPFVFGGDGATVLIPPSLEPSARQALQHLQALAQTAYGLTLRSGILPVHDILAAGYPLTVLKWAASDTYAQAMFSGGGLVYAERLIKHPEYGSRYRLAPNHQAQGADLSGLECRWQEVPSPHDETLTLLISATTSPDQSPFEVYDAVLQQIQQIYGTAEEYQPVRRQHLRVSLNPRRLWTEVRLRATEQGISKLRALWQVWVQSTLGAILMRFGVQTAQTDWGEYRALVQAATDYQKYDDTLRMVIASTHAQRRQLLAYLQQEHARGRLAYGYHRAPGVVLTCLVFERMGRQVHFVDGSGGGYTQAAQMLKSQLKSFVPLPYQPLAPLKERMVDH